MQRNEFRCLSSYVRTDGGRHHAGFNEDGSVCDRPLAHPYGPPPIVACDNRSPHNALYLLYNLPTPRVLSWERLPFARNASIIANLDSAAAYRRAEMACRRRGPGATAWNVEMHREAIERAREFRSRV